MSGDPQRAVLARAIRAATQQARWEALDLLARKGRQSAPDLLRGRAAELAFAPRGYDQLLSLALDQGARVVDEGAVLMALDLDAMLEPAPLPEARQARLLEQAVQVADNGEIELAQEGAAAPGLSRADQGALCRRLWSDARIPADDATRARMLRIGARLQPPSAHAQDRSPHRCRLGTWARRILERWRRR